MSSHDLNVEPVSAPRLPISAPRDYDGALIVRSKLHPPPPRRGAVVRRELLGRLDEDTGDATVKLILVVAPAGWGKTSLLGEWWSSRDAASAAWLSADRGDNDPARFWAHLVAAMRRASESIGPDAERLPTIPEGKIAEILVPQVINDFSRVPDRITVVIDNYHLISNPDIHEWVGFLIENLPPTVRIVLVTRSDPALPLARLRARGEMKEIRADELRFSEEETEGLLNGALNLGLPSDHVRVLAERTEGWAAGLYLAGLSLRGNDDLDRQVHAFAGDNRQIVDYLVAEVLDAQPAHIRGFLTRTAVLDRMCAGLCDAVTGEGGSQRTLEELERSNLFIVPLDASRSWYRYHSLFADMLRRELERSEPGLAPLLHQRASQWHRQHGSAAEAVCHSIMASDLSCAREMIAAPWQGRFADGLAEMVESWLTSLSPDTATEDSRLRLMKAWLASHLGNLDEVEPWVGVAEAATVHGRFVEGPSSIESAACILRAGSSHMLGDLADAKSAGRRAVELEATGSRRWKAVAQASLGASLHWLGENEEATEVLSEVADPLAQPADNLAALWALGCLSAIALRNGDVDSCERHLDDAASLVARHGLGEYRESATALLALAELHECRGELSEAEEAALRGLHIARRGQARLEAALALLYLANVRARLGRADEAVASLSSAKDVMRRCAEPGILADLMASTERAVGELSRLPGPRQERRGQRSDGLTDREVEVFELLAAGQTNNEIAAALVVSVHTVERHLQNAYRKIGARNRGQAAAYITRAARLASGSPVM
ncbi:MAG TPA: LuxR C-terminal-related transcriptional regulator [Streptosporangiaceae bacterium]|nr:LuxR C-terminal-related transcriptional regulator [Streptosporangiaceae bacterium]